MELLERKLSSSGTIPFISDIFIQGINNWIKWALYNNQRDAIPSGAIPFISDIFIQCVKGSTIELNELFTIIKEMPSQPSLADLRLATILTTSFLDTELTDMLFGLQSLTKYVGVLVKSGIFWAKLFITNVYEW